MEEIWKIIPGLDRTYSASSLGRIRRERPGCGTHVGRILITSNGHRYAYVSLNYKKIEKTFLVHRLIAITFLGKPTKRTQVNHKDGNKRNNTIENLEYMTTMQNKVHALKLGLIPRGGNHHNSKLKEEDVLEIRRRYKKGIYTSCKLSKEFNIHKDTILQIVKRRTWTHI